MVNQRWRWSILLYPSYSFANDEIQLLFLVPFRPLILLRLPWLHWRYLSNLVCSFFGLHIKSSMRIIFGRGFNITNVAGPLLVMHETKIRCDFYKGSRGFDASVGHIRSSTFERTEGMLNHFLCKFSDTRKSCQRHYLLFKLKACQMCNTCSLAWTLKAVCWQSTCFQRLGCLP